MVVKNGVPSQSRNTLKLGPNDSMNESAIKKKNTEEERALDNERTDVESWSEEEENRVVASKLVQGAHR